MIIGITGKSGSGKSYLSSLIQTKLNCGYLDVDKVVKKIRDINKEEICLLVKENILVNDKIDSKKLGNILFKDKELMDKYNAYIYKLLKLEIEKELNTNEHLIIDTMFLPIMEIFNDCDYKVLVESSYETRKERVLKRDSINEEYFTSRDKFSLDYNPSDYDYLINTIDKESLNTLIEFLYHMQSK